MPLLEAQRFAHVQLKKTPQFSLIVLGVAVVFGLWKLFEIVVAVYFLRWYQLSPSALLTDSAILWHIIRWVLAVPKAVMKISCSWHIWQLSAKATGILSNGEIFPKGKKFVLSLQNSILRTVMLQPVPLMLFAAVHLVEKDELQSGNALWLVIAAQFVVAAAVWSILWVFFCLALWGVPVLWMSHPNMSLWKVPMLAVRVLCGGIWELVGMLLWYSVQMLPLVTIPWVLPRAILSVTAFFHIRLQTWEETHSKNPHYFALICSTVGK